MIAGAMGSLLDADADGLGMSDFQVFEIGSLMGLGPKNPVFAAYLPEFDLIVIKQNCSETRKRFSIAHELGHAQLEHIFGSNETMFSIQHPAYFRCEERDVDMDNGMTRAQRPRAEVLANNFAAHLLMPAALVREVWRRHRDVLRIASDLHVSTEAAGIRLADLALT
jgi:Zn-dependent peptidase ImmA (M78 family)